MAGKPSFHVDIIILVGCPSDVQVVRTQVKEKPGGHTCSRLSTNHSTIDQGVLPSSSVPESTWWTRTHRLTVADAEESSRFLAKRLIASGVGKGTRVGTAVFPQGVEFVIALLGITRIARRRRP